MELTARGVQLIEIFTVRTKQRRPLVSVRIIEHLTESSCSLVATRHWTVKIRFLQRLKQQNDPNSTNNSVRDTRSSHLRKWAYGNIFVSNCATQRRHWGMSSSTCPHISRTSAGWPAAPAPSCSSFPIEKKWSELGGRGHLRKLVCSSISDASCARRPPRWGRSSQPCLPPSRIWEGLLGVWVPFLMFSPGWKNVFILEHWWC